MVSPELLQRYPYFAPIDDENLRQVAMITEERTVPADTVMFYENDPADTLFVILEGEVNIEYILGSGERRVVDTLGPGDLLVWSALVEPHRTTGIGTATKQTQLIAIDAPKLRALCEQAPELGTRLMTQVAKLLANRLEGARVQLAVG